MDTVHRIAEHMERKALTDLHAAATPELRRKLGLRLETVGGALVSIATGAPGIMLNRTLGLGVERPATEDDIAAVRRLYTENGIDRYFIHVDPEARPETLPDLLVRNGLTRQRGWMKFVRDDAPAPNVSTDLTVREARPEEAEAFGRIAAAAFDLPQSCAALGACLYGRPGWHIIMSFDGDRPAGTGALLVDGDVAWTDWGATDPAFRRRGGQGAVLAARVELARSLGCKTIITATGEAVEGDPQHSYHNILRMGFKEAYLRPNYAPPKQAVAAA